jgi:hypothetical protein
MFIVEIPTFLTFYITYITFQHYLETSGGQNSKLYLIEVYLSQQVLIRHQLQLKTAVFLHRCLTCAVLLLSLEIFC